MDLLNKLNIEETNFGACIGGAEWLDTGDLSKNISVNPATNQEIASVYESDKNHYETVIKAAKNSFIEWRSVPAPVRGQLVREMADALRDKKDELGSLVSLEMGKIKQEGDGEVQEMIDIADFAVGQSRMLYGKACILKDKTTGCMNNGIL